jgi:GT2 family glycosyltransferase
MATPRVVAVVLNTNRRDDTLACLGSLRTSTYPNLAIMALDNASTDGSVEAIRAAFPEVTIVPLAENSGYAGNNNVGIRLALEQGADWVFVANEDTLVDANCLTYLVEAALQRPRIGVVGPMVYTFGDDRIISSAGGVIDWWHADAKNAGMGEIDRGQYRARPVDFINGCGMLVNRVAIETAGLLDQSFFIYYEETDWCVRIQRCGYGLWFEPRAWMRHKAPIQWSGVGPSTLYYMTRNRVRFFARHASVWLKPIAVAQAVRGAWAGIRRHEREGRPEHARATRWALRHALGRQWGKVDASLWVSDTTDRTLQATASKPASGP